MIACIQGNLKTVEFLLSKRADYTIRNEAGWNCLFLAVANNHAGVAKSLILAT